MADYVRLDDRAVLAVSGEDARTFLQGLISNDIAKVRGGAAVHAALLSPQGKYLFDFFIIACGDALWLDCEAAGRDALRRRLAMYRLRAKVAIDDGLTNEVYAVIGRGAAAAASRIDRGLAFADPRIAALGARLLIEPGERAALEAAGLRQGSRADYDALRIGLGVPDGSRDLIAEKSFLLENGFEALEGVDFEKGCYVGQEVTARMKHRNLVRKRLVPVYIDGPAPPPGTAVHRGAVEVGEIRSTAGDLGLALLRLDAIEAADEAAAPLQAGPSGLTVRKPDWADF